MRGVCFPDPANLTLLHVVLVYLKNCLDTSTMRFYMDFIWFSIPKCMDSNKVDSIFLKIFTVKGGEGGISGTTFEDTTCGRLRSLTGPGPKKMYEH